MRHPSRSVYRRTAVVLSLFCALFSCLVCGFILADLTRREARNSLDHAARFIEHWHAAIAQELAAPAQVRGNGPRAG